MPTEHQPLTFSRLWPFRARADGYDRAITFHDLRHMVYDSERAAREAGQAEAAAVLAHLMAAVCQEAEQAKDQSAPISHRLARFARRAGLNLNWLGDPVTAFRRAEALRLPARRFTGAERSRAADMPQANQLDSAEYPVAVRAYDDLGATLQHIEAMRRAVYDALEASGATGPSAPYALIHIMGDLIAKADADYATLWENRADFAA